MGFSVLAIAALAASAIAIDIPAALTWPSGRCTDKSLTIPSWILSEYVVADGVTSFKIDNRAADPAGIYAIAECKGEGRCGGSSGTSQFTIDYSTGPDGPVISLYHFWICEDEGDKVIFAATGNTTITQCAGSDCVSPITYLVPGTLSLPVPVTPTQPPPSPGYDAESCASVGDNQWTVTEVSYRNYTKGQCLQWYGVDRICLDPPVTTGLDFISRGIHLDLKVTNNAIEHEVSCSFKPDYNNNIFIPVYPFRCTGGEFNEVTLDITLTGALPDLDIKVEEVWYCLENPSTNVNPTVISASGSAPLPLTCATSTGITNTTDDIITTCTNTAPSIAVNGVQNDKQTLEPFSLVTAYPVHGGCTFDSVVNPTIYFRDMRFTTTEFPADDPNSATLSDFTAGLTGAGYKDYFFYYDEEDVISGTGVDTVYDCNEQFNGQPIHWICHYSFNPFTQVITLDKGWQCSDKDEAHPIYFEGTGSYDWSIYPFTRCSNTDTHIDCSYGGDIAILQPGIPYDIPKVTTSLTNVLTNAAQSRVKTLRVNSKWAVAT